jgi:hypothetical protein
MNPFRSTRADNIIPLTADSDHKWIQTASKVLFVPSCYDDIWEICVRRLAVFDGVVISGTPGIGKSCFLDFALHNLLADDIHKSVMYVHGKSGSAYVYAADGSVESYSIADVRNNDMATDVDFLLLDPPEGGDPNFFGKDSLHSIHPCRLPRSQQLSRSTKRCECGQTLHGGNEIYSRRSRNEGGLLSSSA